MHALTANAGGSLYEAYVRAAGLGQTLVGCLASDGAARVLTTLGTGNEDGAAHLKQAVVDGRFAAVIINYVDQHYGVGTAQYVEVYDLRTGRMSSTLGHEQSGFLDDLVLNGSGDTAVHAAEEHGTYGVESILASTASGVHTIASVPSNPPYTTLADLSLTGTTLSYTDNGTPESTELP
jgi:hypothetical protein